MSGVIFLLDDNGKLAKMSEQPYPSEDLLQQFLASYPDLLPGDQIDPGAPRRWLLVTRELGVPGESDGPDRWALDHLFLDQDAVPTLVEVKRRTDSRIRREVVGQMLDYAANAVAYLPVEGLEARFEGTCRAKEVDPAIELYNALGHADAAEFWQRVDTNLKAQRVRLVFVADVIPPELQRVVEFLNGQMDPAEVLAVEVKQFVGEGVRTLVPRVIGLTAAAEAKKQPVGRAKRRWDETSFFEELAKKCGPTEVVAARAVYDWAGVNGWERAWWGGETGGFALKFPHAGDRHTAVAVYTNGSIEVLFSWMRDKSPFSDPGKRSEFRTRLTAVPGVTLQGDRLDKLPTFPLTALTDPAARQEFFAALDWWAEQVRAVASGSP
ncbi:MAG: hypothetical protein K2X87_34905 [Gemmataceae bacterium]|nr:hypothetical protein [Gemmataceae bacterium]